MLFRPQATDPGHPSEPDEGGNSLPRFYQLLRERFSRDSEDSEVHAPFESTGENVHDGVYGNRADTSIQRQPGEKLNRTRIRAFSP